MLLLRANTLALGHSGCRPLLVDRLLAFLELGHPPGRARAGQRRRVGRPGAAGPPRPAAHRPRPGGVATGRSCPALIALREVGPGAADARGQGGPRAAQRDPDDERHRGARCSPMPTGWPGPRASRRRCRVEALLGTDVAFAAAYQLARPHPGQVAVAAELRHLLRDSALQTRPPRLTRTRSRTRTRCAACRRSTARSATRSTTCGGSSTSSSTRRPTTRSSSRAAASPTRTTIATGGGRVISGGNFHGEPIALALDFAKLALAELGSISERRTALLVDPRLNGGLPPFLARVVRARLRDDDLPVHGRGPRLASTRSWPTRRRSTRSRRAPNQEDHVSMGSIAARHARTVLTDVERIVAIELLVAAQALDLRLAASGRRAARAPGPGWPRRTARIRARVAHLDRDREPGPDLAAATALVHDGALGRPRRLTGPVVRLRADERDHDRRRHRCDRFGRPAVRRSRVRPSLVRLLGGRRPRVEGGPARLARSRVAARPPEPLRGARPANPFLADLEAKAPVANPFADRRRRSNPFLRLATTTTRSPTTRSRRGPPPRPAVGPDAPRKLQLLGRGLGVVGSYAKVLLADDVASGLRPVRAADRLSPGAADARPLPGAARRAAARRHHLHRHDRRGPRRRPRQGTRRGGLRRPRPGAASRPSRRTRRSGPAGRDQRRDARVLGSVGFALAIDDERFPVMRRELA